MSISFYNHDAIQMTLNSYREAMTDMLNIVSRVVPVGNQGNEPMPTSWKPAMPTPADRLISYTTRAFAMHRELTVSYASPGYNPSNFFTVSAVWETTFERHGYDWSHSGCDEYTDDEGTVHPARPYVPERWYTSKHALTLELFTRSWSPRDFVAKHDEVTAFMDETPAEIRKPYLEAVAAAMKEVERYNKAIEKLSGF